MMDFDDEAEWITRERCGLTPLEIEEIKNGPFVSDPAKRGTPEAALVDAIWAEDLASCRQLLDDNPELINATIRQFAHFKSVDIALVYAPYALGETATESYLKDVPPVVFACLLPRWKQPDCEIRIPTAANLEIIRLLFQHGAVLNPYWKVHILAEVCWIYDSPEVMKLLVSHGAETLDGGGIEMLGVNWTLLQLAARVGRVKSVEFLLDHGASMEPDVLLFQSESSGRWYSDDGTPLNGAAHEGRDDVVELLLKRGATQYLEEKGFYFQQTPLAAAIRPMGERLFVGKHDFRRERREKIIRMLIEAGARYTNLDGPFVLRIVSPDPGPCEPTSILKDLVNWGSPAIIRYVVEKGCDIHERMAFGQISFDEEPKRGERATVLHQAAQSVNVECVKTLLELGADANALDDCGQNPLHWMTLGTSIAQKRRISSIAWNIRNDEIDNGLPSKPGALDARYLWAARLDETEATMTHLFHHGTNINQQDHLGRAPLHYITDLSLNRTIVFLVNHGADLALVDASGRTVLHEMSTIPEHLDKDARPTETSEPDPDYEGLYISLKESLGERSASIVNQLTANGETALHMASSCLFVPMIDILLRLGANPNILDASGSTALHRASIISPWLKQRGYAEEYCGRWMQRFGEAKTLLLDAGADARLHNADGQQPPDEAEMRQKVAFARQDFLRQQEEARRLEELRWGTGSGGRGRGGWMRGGLGRGRPT